MAKALQAWLGHLKSEVSEDLQLGRDICHNFFHAVCNDEVALQKLFMRTPHHS